MSIIDEIIYDGASGDVEVSFVADKTDVDYAYILAEYDDGEISYKKLDAVVSVVNGVQVITGNVPSIYEHFVVVLVDMNNIMVQSGITHTGLPSVILDIKAVENYNYGLGNIATLYSEEQTTPGGQATYQIALDVTPPAGKAVMSGFSNGTSTTASWGLGSGLTGATVVDFIFNIDESVENIGDLRVHNFTSQTGSLYTEDSFSNITLESITIVNGSTANKDAVAFEFNGVSNDVGKLDSGTETLVFESDYGITNLQEFTLKNGVSVAPNANKWAVETITVKIYPTVEALSLEGVQEKDIKELILRPNPARDAVYLNITPLETRVYDMTGRLLRKYGKGKQSLDISNLRAGIYNLIVTDLDGNRTNSKLIKN